MAAVLLRLNSGFVEIIDRFTRGKINSTDYQALLNLSNSSRLEAIKTFQDLHDRIAVSTTSVATSGRRRRRAPGQHRSHSGREKQKTSRAVASYSCMDRSKSAPELRITALGPVTPEGWVRYKKGKKSSSLPNPRSEIQPSPTHKSPQQVKHRPNPTHGMNRLNNDVSRLDLPPRIPLATIDLNPQNANQHRFSLMSFASDSTKLGEIPLRKWSRPEQEFQVTPAYPAQPYHEPEKQKSKFFRIFRRNKSSLETVHDG